MTEFEHYILISLINGMMYLIYLDFNAVFAITSFELLVDSDSCTRWGYFMMKNVLGLPGGDVP